MVAVERKEGDRGLGLVIELNLGSVFEFHASAPLHGSEGAYVTSLHQPHRACPRGYRVRSKDLDSQLDPRRIGASFFGSPGLVVFSKVL